MVFMDERSSELKAKLLQGPHTHVTSSKLCRRCTNFHSSKSVIRRRRSVPIISRPSRLPGRRLLQPLPTNTQLATEVLPAPPTEPSPRITLRIGGSLGEELAVHAVLEIWRHPFGEMVAQLAVCWVPEDGDAVFAAGALNDRRRGGGRAGGEGYPGEDGPIQFVEVFSDIMYEFTVILLNSASV
jgi:hypothetical protein